MRDIEHEQVWERQSREVRRLTSRYYYANGYRLLGGGEIGALGPRLACAGPTLSA